jgi:hypothetical protein
MQIKYKCTLPINKLEGICVLFGKLKLIHIWGSYMVKDKATYAFLSRFPIIRNKHWTKSIDTIHNAPTREFCQVQHKTGIIDDRTLVLQHAIAIIAIEWRQMPHYISVRRLSKLTLNVAGLKRTLFLFLRAKKGNIVILN